MMKEMLYKEIDTQNTCINLNVLKQIIRSRKIKKNSKKGMKVNMETVVGIDNKINILHFYDFLQFQCNYQISDLKKNIHSILRNHRILFQQVEITKTNQSNFIKIQYQSKNTKWIQVLSMTILNKKKYSKDLENFSRLTKFIKLYHQKISRHQQFRQRILQHTQNPETKVSQKIFFQAKPQYWQTNIEVINQQLYQHKNYKNKKVQERIVFEQKNSLKPTFAFQLQIKKNYSILQKIQNAMIGYVDSQFGMKFMAFMMMIFIDLILQYQFISQQFMNRSITKTRNQLQRITFKINQLKNKYTQNQNYPLSLLQNSPIPHHQIQSNCKSKNHSKSKDFQNLYQKQQILSFSNNSSVKNSVKNGQNDEQLKTLKRQLINYVNNCVGHGRDSQHQTAKKLQQLNAVILGVQNRIKKIEEEMTNWIDDISQNKNQKDQILEKKIQNIQNCMRKTLLEISVPRQVFYENDFNAIKQEIQKFKEQCQDQINSLIEKRAIDFERKNENINKRIEKSERITKQEQNQRLSILEINFAKILEYQNKNSTQIKRLEESMKQIEEEKLNISQNISRIEQKLIEFKNDISLAIRQLQIDVQKKKYNNSFDVEFNLNEAVKDLQVKVKSLTLLAIDTKEQDRKIDQNNALLTERFEQMKSQIYDNMGKQIEKLSSIIERTFEEIQMKVQKLDDNFAYVHEKMSNIQYDNANFKDKLAFLAFAPRQQDHVMKQQKSNNNLLDLFSQLNKSNNSMFLGQI